MIDPVENQEHISAHGALRYDYPYFEDCTDFLETLSQNDAPGKNLSRIWNVFVSSALERCKNRTYFYANFLQISWFFVGSDLNVQVISKHLEWPWSIVYVISSIRFFITLEIVHLFVVLRI